MPEWECNQCGNTVEAPQEPEQCPCGSQDISRVEEPGFLGTLREKIGF
ncbi:MAG: hypothetical protein ABEI58_04330 [Candidatus Nanohaloarchaea archaeon]